MVSLGDQKRLGKAGATEIAPAGIFQAHNMYRRLRGHEGREARLLAERGMTELASRIRSSGVAAHLYEEHLHLGVRS